MRIVSGGENYIIGFGGTGNIMYDGTAAALCQISDLGTLMKVRRINGSSAK